jgi:hypothetical protein
VALRLGRAAPRTVCAASKAESWNETGILIVTCLKETSDKRGAVTSNHHLTARRPGPGESGERSSHIYTQIPSVPTMPIPSSPPRPFILPKVPPNIRKVTKSSPYRGGIHLQPMTPCTSRYHLHPTGHCGQFSFLQAPDQYLFGPPRAAPSPVFPDPVAFQSWLHHERGCTQQIGTTGTQGVTVVIVGFIWAWQGLTGV